MNPRLPIVLAFAVLAAACGAKVASEAPEKQDPPFTFPHSTHVDADVACKNCHPMEKATKLEQGVRHVQIPASPSKNKVCSDCHDTDPKPSLPKRARPFRVTFDHATHLPRVNGDCKRCHKEQTEAGDKAPKALEMATCTGCHKHQQDYAESRCMPCHVDLKGYKPETAFKHEGDWLARHGQSARPSAESCAACHDQTFCAECHSPQTVAGRPSVLFPERVDRSYIHRGDYVSRHMIEEGANPASCRKCHGSAFCDACHQANNVSASLPSPRDPHPAGWATPATPGELPPHAHAAKRDIVSCAGCHDQGASATCIGCHRVGGIADTGDPNGPHPTSFITKHRGEDKTKNSMCAACHPTP